MPERVPALVWAPTSVPPLRADIDRHRREYRRSLRRIERTGWVAVSALLGFVGGAFAALPPGTFA